MASLSYKLAYLEAIRVWLKYKNYKGDKRKRIYLLLQEGADSARDFLWDIKEFPNFLKISKLYEDEDITTYEDMVKRIFGKDKKREGLQGAKEKAYVNAEGRLINSLEACDWLYSFAKRKYHTTIQLDEEQTRECIWAFKKRYDIESYSDAQRFVKGLGYGENAKKYSVFLDTQFGNYYLSIEKKSTTQKLLGVEKQSNAYYRARIAAIQKLQDSNPSIKKFLQNGFVPADRKDSFEKFIEDYIVNHVDNSPLTFTEQMTYNTWYEQHPEKVAGTMVEGSSLYFPVLVKGTKKDVENMFKAALKEQEQKPDDELELLELEAEALALELEMGKRTTTPTKTFRVLVEENGDKILHWREATDPNKEYVTPFNYSVSHGGSIDSFKYYNDYVVEISKDKLSGTEDYTPYYEFIKTAISSNSHKRIDCTSLLSKHSLDSVKRLLNREIDKFYLTANDLRHIINRHSGRRELKNGQIPITIEDLLRIPEILSRPTSIELGSYSYKYGSSIRFTRNFVDGKQYCVLVEVYDSRRTALAVKTGYKKPLSGSLNGYVPPLHGIDALQIADPKHNARNARAVPMLYANIITFFRTR